MGPPELGALDDDDIAVEDFLVAFVANDDDRITGGDKIGEELPLLPERTTFVGYSVRGFTARARGDIKSAVSLTGILAIV